MATQEQIEFFRTNGYLKFGKVLEPEQIDELRAGLARVIEIELAGGDDSSPEFRYGHRRAAQEGDFKKPITQFINMWKREAAYEHLLHLPQIAGTACALLDTPRVRLWHDQIISKPPGDNGHFHFHQDFYLWPLRDPRILTCWLALDDAKVENGCMHVVPGSHRDPRFGLDAYATELENRAKAEAAGKTVEESERQQMAHAPASIGKAVELKAGECMFHHCLNFHATPANVTDQQRRAHVMIFMAEGVRVKLDQSPQHPLISTFAVNDGEPLVGDGYPLSRLR